MRESLPCVEVSKLARLHEDGGGKNNLSASVMSCIIPGFRMIGDLISTASGGWRLTDAVVDPDIGGSSWKTILLLTCLPYRVPLTSEPTPGQNGGRKLDSP
jgi:hypothetical protein